MIVAGVVGGLAAHAHDGQKDHQSEMGHAEPDSPGAGRDGLRNSCPGLIAVRSTGRVQSPALLDVLDTCADLIVKSTNRG